MKALILVGGFGTRLRPLTFSKPKPLVEFCNEPIMEHQVAALAAVGVTEIVLAVNYKPDAMAEALRVLEAKYHLKIIISLETEPMGTAGPLALARDHLAGSEPFFVFNSDVTCEYPLKALLEFHKAHGKEGTVLVTTVTDPSKYGVVVHDERGQISRFVEKPTTWVGNHINAGMYCLNPTVLSRIPMKPTSIEKEVFPFMAAEGQLFAMELPGYWMDIGQPRDFIAGTSLHLGAIRKRSPALLATGDGIVGNVLIDPTATVAPGSVLGPDVVIGAGCVVQAGARLERCTLFSEAKVESGAYVSTAIVGWKSTIGRWAHVEGGTVLGEDVQVGEGKVLVGATVCPNKGIKDSSFEPGKVFL